MPGLPAYGAGATPPPRPGYQYVPGRGYVALATIQAEQRALELQRQTDADRIRQQQIDDAARNTEQDRYSYEQRIRERDADRARMDAERRFQLGRRDIFGAINSLDGGSGGGGGGGGAIGGGSGAGGGTGGSPGVPPAGGGGIPAVSDADRAFYTRAKENTGQTLSAAQRGLSEQMQQRGITGSGIEARGLTELFEAGQGDLAETDRQLAEGGADRAYQSSEAALGRIWQGGENAADRQAGVAGNRLNALLALYGMLRY